MKRLIKKSIVAGQLPTDIEIPSTMYHATFNAYIPSIKEKGLITNSGNSNWDGMVEGNAVYLATDYDVAESYADSAEVDDDVYDSGITVLSIDTTKLDKNNFGTDQNIQLDEGEEPETFAYYGNIPTSAITF